MSTVASQPISLSDVKNAIATQGAGTSTPLPLGDERLVKAALVLATLLQKRAATLQTPQERRQQAELDRMLQHPEDKATLTQITDQSFRSDTPAES